MGLPLGEESDQSPKFTKTILPVNRCACPLFSCPLFSFSLFFLFSLFSCVLYFLDCFQLAIALNFFERFSDVRKDNGPDANCDRNELSS